MNAPTSTAAAREEVLELRLKGLRLTGFLAHHLSLAKKAAAEGHCPRRQDWSL
jgi:hypothetical protein